LLECGTARSQRHGLIDAELEQTQLLGLCRFRSRTNALIQMVPIGQGAVVTNHIKAWARHQCGESGEEDIARDIDIGRAAGGGLFEVNAECAIWQSVDGFACKRWSNNWHSWPRS